MNLTDYLTDIIAGLLGGFFIGKYGLTETSQERIQFMEEINNVKELKVAHKEIEGKLRKSAKSLTNLGRILYPALWGYYLSYLPSLFTNKDFSQNAPLTTISSFAGFGLGVAYRKFSRGKDREILLDIQQNPSKASNYLPKRDKKLLEEALSEIESNILKGISANLSEVNSKYSDLISSVLPKQKIYSPALSGYLLRKLNDTIDETLMQKSYIEFLENSPVGTTAFISKEDNEVKPDNIKLFEFDGKNFRIYNVNFDSFTSVYNEVSNDLQLKGTIPRITLESERIWDKDFKGLAKRLHSSRNDETIINLKSAPNLKPELREWLVSKAFIVEYSDSIKRKYVSD